MSKKKKRLIIGVVIVCTAVLIGAVVVCNIRNYLEENRSVIKYSYDINTIQYVEFNRDTGGICMVFSGEYPSPQLFSSNVFDGKYIYTEDFYYIWWLFRHKTVVKKADVNIYDLETMELIKTIDIKKILKEYLPGREWKGRFILEQKEGGDVWACITAEEDGITEMVYINLITDEIIVLRHGETFNGMEEYEEDRLKDSKTCLRLLEKDEIGIVEKNGLPENIQVNYTDGYFYTKIEIPKESLPTGDIRLYQKFPGLKDYEMNDDEILCIYLDITKSVAEESIDMFLEEGQEISFEGCVLPAELSIDGKEHEINSFEDYYQWRDWDKY